MNRRRFLKGVALTSAASLMRPGIVQALGDDRSSVADRLKGALGDSVLVPGTSPYEKVLCNLFYSGASIRKPSCIVQPGSSSEIARTVEIVGEMKSPMTVRGGGLSSLCVADGAVMVDMPARLGGFRLTNESIEARGGATMGGVIDTASRISHVVPIGVAKMPGMGLAFQGGVGYLSRSLGLTLDALQAVEFVTPAGEVLQLSNESTGDEADLWWAVRGCAPNFGVVSAATFKSYPLSRLFVQRKMMGLSALKTYLEVAPTLPRDTSMSLVLGPPAARPGDPVLYLYAVYAGDDSAGITRVKQQTQSIVADSGSTVIYEADQTLAYVDTPPFDIPATDGRPSPAPPACAAVDQRVFAFVKSYFLKNPIDEKGAEIFAAAIRSAPTPLCRIDLQHCGGAVADVEPTATAFWNRKFEWNCVVTGAWVGENSGREACSAWVRRTVRDLAPYVVGDYPVEIRPRTPEAETEVRMAFGGNLERLSRLKKRWDPDNLFSQYYSIG